MDSQNQADKPTARRHLTWNFGWGASTGALYELGIAFIDTSTIVPAFLGNLTGSSLIVGAAESLRRYGWLVPQLFVANYAQGRRYRKPIYLFAGFGRAACIALLAGTLFVTGGVTSGWLLAMFFVAWTGYSFISGVAGVPYNDIVGRVIPSERRSTFLSIRFLGGGILAAGAGLLIVGGTPPALLARKAQFPFPTNYGLIFGLGAASLTLSSLAFSLIREPPAPVEAERQPFTDFLRAGWAILQRDRQFRLFYAYQLFAGVTAMALPFYVLQARQVSGLPESAVGTLLAAQQVGNVISNPVWGGWGDRLGKLSLLKGLSWAATVSPAVALVIPFWPASWLPHSRPFLLVGYGVVFFFIGALLSGEIIGHISYLMEISPDALRADYSGYMSTFVAPVRLLPLLAGVLVDLISFQVLFAVALLSVVGRLWLLARLDLSGR